MKAKATLSNYRQHDTYKYTESEDIRILTNFANSNVICQWTQQNFKCSDCNNKQVFRMIDSWLNLFCPRGSDIYNEKKNICLLCIPLGTTWQVWKIKIVYFWFPREVMGNIVLQKKILKLPRDCSESIKQHKYSKKVFGFFCHLCRCDLK